MKPGGIESAGPTENAPELDSTKAYAPYRPCANLYLGGLRPDIQADTVRLVFSQYGEVEDVELFPKVQEQVVALLKLSNIHDASWIKENLHENLPAGLDQENGILVRFALP